MKKLLRTLIVCVLFAGCASFDPPAAKVTEYVKVIETGRPASDTFDSTMKWMAKYFVSPKSVIQYSDKISGLITGKALLRIEDNALQYIDIDYTVTIEIKDNKTRFTFNTNNISAKLYGSAYQERTLPVSQQAYDAFIPKADALLTSYQNYLKTETGW